MGPWHLKIAMIIMIQSGKFNPESLWGKMGNLVLHIGKYQGLKKKSFIQRSLFVGACRKLWEHCVVRSLLPVCHGFSLVLLYLSLPLFPTTCTVCDRVYSLW